MEPEKNPRNKRGWCGLQSPTLTLDRAHMETQKLESTGDCRKSAVQASSVPDG